MKRFFYCGFSVLFLLFSGLSPVHADVVPGLPEGVLFLAETPSVVRLSQSAVMFSQGLSQDAAGKIAVITTGVMMNPQLAPLNISAPFSFLLMESPSTGTLFPCFTAWGRPSAKVSNIRNLFGVRVNSAHLPDGRYLFFESDSSAPNRPGKAFLSRIPGTSKGMGSTLSCKLVPSRLARNKTFLSYASGILFRGASGVSAVRELSFLCADSSFFSAELAFPEPSVASLSFRLTPLSGTDFAASLKKRPVETLPSFSGFPSADTWISVRLPNSSALRSFLGLFPENAILCGIIPHASGRAWISQKTADLTNPVLKAEIELLWNAPSLKNLPGLSEYIEPAGIPGVWKTRPRREADLPPMYFSRKGSMLTIVSARVLSPADAQKLFDAHSDFRPPMHGNYYIRGIKKSEGKFLRYLDVSPSNGELHGTVLIYTSDFQKFE